MTLSNLCFSHTEFMGYTPLDIDKFNTSDDKLITVALAILDVIAMILIVLLFFLIKQKIANG